MREIEEIFISMSSAKAADLFDRLAHAAADADGVGGAFRVSVAAVWNDGGATPVALVFDNEDMERADVADLIIVDRA